jgi:hypothetical protein
VAELGVAWINGFDLRRIPAIDVSIGEFYCAMWRSEGLRRLRRKSGASLVWREKAEGVSIYSCARAVRGRGGSPASMALQGAKGHGRGRRA